MFTAEDYPYSGKVLLAALISLSIVITFILLLHAYARWLLKRRPVDIRDLPREPPPPLPPHRRSSATLPRRASEARLSTSVNGLDASVVASLPLFVYGSGPSGEHGEDLECVVCLGAMAAGETGRLLPGCKHVFHVGCIDVWFMLHSTCPICRAEVKLDGLHGVQEGDAVQVARGEEEVLLLHELAGGNLDETIVSGDSGARGVAEVMVSIPLSSVMEDQIIAKESEPSSSISTTTTSCGCSLKRILSRSRSCH